MGLTIERHERQTIGRNAYFERVAGRRAVLAISLMFCAAHHRILASMGATDWSDADVSDLLPTGTVTLLLADLEGSTRLWETRPDEMSAAVARLDQVLSAAISEHHGARPTEQGEGDSFVIAFARASDAVACALDLQRAPLAPISMRIGLHTGEVQLRDENNYIGPTINRTARLRDLGHGGQTLLSSTTSDLVVDRLPDGAFVTELGSHPLRDLPRLERVVQLGHPDLHNEFPPLRTPNTVAGSYVPVQLTSFVGRSGEIAAVGAMFAEHRLITLTGAGGVGKTRLAIEIALQSKGQISDGVWYVDLAPITDPEVVPTAVMRALGLSDLPGSAPMDILVRFIGNGRALMVLDNCEHLLDASAGLVDALLAGCPGLTVLTTSREPIGTAGEATWRVPSLPLADDAIELFAQRARLARADFRVTDVNAATVLEICRRLDGMPLAIELAAARVRALSLTEILDSLHDRFMLLTGGARTAVRRQQTLRASVDWSHALLTESERVLFRRLAVFRGGFDLEGARAVGGGGDVEAYQVLDQLSLLVDKSLVVAEDIRGRTRYRLLETMRQYAQEKLGESGESVAVRNRHRDYFAAGAATLESPPQHGGRWRVMQAENEIDNMRAAFDWSRDNGDIETALRLVSSLQPLWVSRGRLREGMGWFDTAFADERARYPGIDAATWVRALANKAVLDGIGGMSDPTPTAQEALTLARQIDDPALVVKALTACASAAAYAPEFARPYVDEAIQMARAAGDRWWLCQILAWKCNGAYLAGEPKEAITAGEEGLQIAIDIGNRFVARACRWGLGWGQSVIGDLAGAVAQFRQTVLEADADADVVWSFTGHFNLAQTLAYQGDTDGARAVVDMAMQVADRASPVYERYASLIRGVVATTTGEMLAPEEVDEAFSGEDLRELQVAKINVWYRALDALRRGDLDAAHRWADTAVAETKGWHRMTALTARARVAIAKGEPQLAERDLHAALALAVRSEAQLGVPDIFETLGAIAAESGNNLEAVRLLAAAEAIRQRTGEVRFKAYDPPYEASVVMLRKVLEEQDFDEAWTEGLSMPLAEAISYAQRGRGERRRPGSGWASLTPAEHDVVRLVCDGLPNKDIAARLFVSPRTVQAHLTHIYTKLGITSRVQLVQEATRQRASEPS